MVDYLQGENKGYKNDICIEYFSNKISYEKLFQNIDKAAQAFWAMGVRRGDIVIVCMVNSPELIYTFYALNLIGAVADMVDPRTNELGIENYCIQDMAKLVVTVDAVYTKIARVTKKHDIPCIVVTPADSMNLLYKGIYKARNHVPKLNSNDLLWSTFISKKVNENFDEDTYSPATCCILAHTGGTTGDPKSVMLSDDNFNAMVLGYKYAGFPFKRNQVFYNDLPPFIMYGFSIGCHVALTLGLKLILYPIFDSKTFPKRFVKYKPNYFSAGIDHICQICTSKYSDKCQLDFLFAAGIGGDGLDRKLEAEINHFLHQHECKYDVAKGYGMTELVATACTSSSIANDIGSVGIPLVFNTVKIVDMDSKEELPIGKSGEIYISGPTIMLGYRNNKEETDRIISIDDNGVKWIKTGDIGHLSKDGLLYHEGRIRRIYVTSVDNQPAKIFPGYVEDQVLKVEGVLQCSIVGRLQHGSEMFYETVAFIKKKPCEDFETLQEKIKIFCKDNIPEYMQPVEYREISEFPKTPIGKTDFRKLEEMCILVPKDNSEGQRN